ncbi:glycosyltransferase family 4 protein [Anthocerotibacter panamensis]|uniref:glycosyltransferase family 4 protein n=1 Tax=Anthocerotibacter panamensis TaxID=2857077 RepID=UPI001C4019C0|nr:glycosyltransferase family 1 protein [Anthocerotibacter panamensis]
MRIGVDAGCWANRRGYGRFTRGLLEALLAQPSEHEYLFFVDAQSYAQQPFPPRAKLVVVPTGQSPTAAASAGGRRAVGDLWAMAEAVRRTPLDVLFFPSVYTYFPAWTQATVILGIHDVIAEDYPDLIFPGGQGRRLWALKGWLARQQANYVLTVSDHARNGILRRFHPHSERIWVVDEAPDPVFRPLKNLDGALLQRYGIRPGERFLIYLGGINPHKNLTMLVQALADLGSEYADVRLLLVGDRADGFTPGLDALLSKITALDLTHRVHFTGFVPDPEVVHLLNAAQVLVLPSVAEGFGLPAVEAAACATPVIATRNSPLPDLLAGGGRFIDPTQPEALTHALREILADPHLREQLGQGAHARASQLSWARTARQMTALLDAIAQERS